MNSKKHLTFFVTLIVALFGLQRIGLATGEPSMKQATELRVNNKVLKTKPARVRDISLLFDALVAFDDEMDRNNDRPPKDARKRLKKINELAPKAKAEILLLANRLKLANEAGDFNALVAARVDASKSEWWASALKSAGNDAYAVLVNAPAIIDKLIADRTELTNKQAQYMRSGPLSPMANSSHRVDTNIKTNALRLPSVFYTACSFGLFVISCGSATDFNYHACMQ